MRQEENLKQKRINKMAVVSPNLLLTQRFVQDQKPPLNLAGLGV
jgi:hypothetical protein